MTLSVCTIAYDEEPFMSDWLRQFDGLVDKIYLGVDSRSTDRTEEIAHAAGAIIVPFEWADSFAAARNTVLERVRADWILVLDPDERLTRVGVDVIERLMGDETVSDLIDGFSPLFQEGDQREYVSGRLIRNDPQLRYVGRVHEEVRYLPNPARTWFERMDGGPHIEHLVFGTLRARKDKDRRDLRLLRLRLLDDSHDAAALFYLWQMTGDMQYAERALACGERALHPDRRAQLEAALAA